MSKPSLLYLYDLEDWAVHNVGKLWLDGLPDVQVTLMGFNQFKHSDFARFDLVWFGYLDLFIDHYCSVFMGKADLGRCLVSVHDPRELFPQREDWKRAIKIAPHWRSASSWHWATKLSILQQVKYVITASKELQSILLTNKVDALLLPTTSSLPPRDAAELATEKCRALTICNTSLRKNFPLMQTIESYCHGSEKMSFDTKIGPLVLPVDDYTELIDGHEVYICTSYQEGGPIPAMDAMQRGCAVLSTPVGQVQELIKHGEDGYICETADDFIEALTLLADDLPLLHRMRLRSLETFHRERNMEHVQARAASVVNEVVAQSQASLSHNTRDVRGVATWLWQRTVHHGMSGRAANETKALLKKLRARP